MHNKKGNRYGAPRPYQIRTALPVVTVVCDDTKTALAYFGELKRELKTKVTLKIEPAPNCGANPTHVVARAEELAGALTPAEEGDSTWALLDMEGEEYKQEEAKQAKQVAKSTVTVLLSNPCFEVWTLAHLVDTGQAFQDCAGVVKRLRAEWRKKFGADFGSKKAQADYSKLMPYRGYAITNASKRRPEQDGSWTEVFRLMQAITLLCSR